MKAFFQKNWIHFAAMAVMFIIVAIFFQPVFEGFAVKQHDLEQWRGMAQETLSYREKTGEHPLWTNSMFSGMPVIQITMLYTGNFLHKIMSFYYEVVSLPIGLVFLHMICFYFMAIMLRIRPVIAVIGAIAYSFASYEIIIIQAGHSAKSMASAYLPLLLGAFIYAYRYKSWFAIALSGVVMTVELSSNHVQVTYYMIFLLLFVGIYFFIQAAKEKTFGAFTKVTIGLIVAYGLAGVVNSPNIFLTNDYAKYTIRGANDVTITPEGTDAVNQSKGLNRDYITNWSYGVDETFTLISPNIKGGGSFYIGGSQFEPILDNSEFSSDVKNSLMRSPAYWGDQPFTSGPVYIGIVVVFLAFLGLIFLKTGLKWPLLIMAVLAVALSWGKNFMGLTDLFIDYIPGYNKFRTVTIILIMVELTIPVIGVLFLDMLVKEKEQIREKKNILLASVLGFFLFLTVVRVVGLGDGYMSIPEKEQVANFEHLILKDLRSYDPETLKAEINLDVNNPNQLAEYVAYRKQAYVDNFENVKTLREDIFNASMNRSLIFTFFAGTLILLFVFTTLPSMVLMGGTLLLVLIDIVPVANEYLGKQEVNGSYKYWEDKDVNKYPFEAREADFQIMEMEVRLNPELEKIIDSAEKTAIEKADQQGIEGKGRINMINSYRFSELNLATNYRVFDRNGGFSSSYTSYLHKSLGGYHGAKLRNFNNLIEFQIAQGNNKVFDMLNVKYIIHSDEKGSFARENPQAMGNAWLVKNVEVYDTPNDEIRALGTRFKLKNEGGGQLVVNDQKVNEATVYGGERIKYVINNTDTIDVPLSNGMSEGMEVAFVMDRNRKTDMVMPEVFENDTAKVSFLKMVRIKAENEFKPTEEAVMLKEWASQLSQQSFTGEGTVKMTNYKPNQITYDVKVKGRQLIVFSEIFYPKDWTATINGKETPVLKANYLLRAIEVPDGDHKVELSFDIPQYHTLNKVALIACIILVLGLIVAIYFEYRRKKVVDKGE